MPRGGGPRGGPGGPPPRGPRGNRGWGWGWGWRRPYYGCFGWVIGAITAILVLVFAFLFV
ncbi:MAG: hypothetical protein LUH59_03435 [Firmicutes bacterium]|nr:hypothetical protein [Bacillota bacterium]